ncbi:enoyl-CoA hydratase [Brucella intermedia GD04153]|uniref:Enoyl-CoA hydratase domain-containing protein 3, mitochondrial n=1 Tax=Brucella intermedia GD04153 TaxID=2975438 RepID=A0AA42H1Z8_9HYPH|nr:enoyl-CoA hydratase [Brucella intermedia]MDH0126855.1 enoyl-CoA hydratase [Brucella intermedia GD04153]
MADTNEPALIKESSGAVVTLTMNRPRTLNCLSEELLTALEEEFGKIEKESKVKCVVLQGNGRAFCAGHDLREMRATGTVEYYEWLFEKCSRTMMRIRDTPVPVIAKVHGDATAAGCQLVATCDLAIASANARFAMAGINLGSFCATPAVALTRKVTSIRKSFEMLFVGDLITAEDACDHGLLNRVVPAEELDKTVADLAGKLSMKSGNALRFGKSQFYAQQEMQLPDAYRFATAGIARSLASADAIEGIDAFLTKRKPVWD